MSDSPGATVVLSQTGTGFSLASCRPWTFCDNADVQNDIDLGTASGENHHVLPAPSTYLVGTDGVIRFQYTNPDYKVRLHPDVLLAAARGYTRDEATRLERALNSGN